MITKPRKPRPIDTPLLRLPWPGRADIFVKDESKCPTGTFKDRLAWRLADLLKEEKVDNRFLITTITLGNTLVSLAAAFQEILPEAERPQLLGLFPEGFGNRIIGPDNSAHTMRGSRLYDSLAHHGTRCIEHPLDQGFLTPDDIRCIAHAAGIEFVGSRDVTYGIGVPAYETILAEALSQGAQDVDVIVVPVGAGVLFDEFVAFTERTGLRARVLGVTTLSETSIADKIYGKYSPYYSALLQTGSASHPMHERHKVIALEDAAIHRVLSNIPRELASEPSAAAAFAPLYMSDQIDPEEISLIVNTGNGILTTQVSSI